MSQAIKRSIPRCETQITQLLDRIVDASSDSVVKAYETRIAKQEKEKLALAERFSQEGKPKHPFGEMFELTMRFLSDPCNIWKNGRFEDKQTVLKLVFSSPLKYKKNEGFRTPDFSSVFSLLQEISGLKEGPAVVSD
jgi:hypothetical protein